ncbi:hypothetical protein AB0F52_41750 [Amycolatopsis sp. NPDC024027]|uniref:hypothetical protein n=1 Tax=Amycolatopsis sp. NPDC024027 TaxID=3154327 RepID=UPI0033EB78C9
MNAFRSTRRALFVAATVLAFGVSGCSTSSDPGVPSSAPESSPAAETSGGSTPSMEPSGPEAPRPSGNGEPALALAQLPIGGSSQGEAGNQCATARWNQPELLPDNGVTVAKIEITPPKGFSVAGGCGGDACGSFTFRRDAISCTVQVNGLGKDDAELMLKGKFTCPPGQGSSCGGHISLHGITGSESSVPKSSVPKSSVTKSSSSPGG